MSQRPIARSEDLQRLRDEGYTISLLGGLLLVRDVPYVDADRNVHDDGILVMPLTLSGDVAQPPPDHTAHFVGGVPCDQRGAQLSKIINSVATNQLANGLVASCMFSAKPVGAGRYRDFHEKVVTHVAQIEAPAQALRGEVTARRHRPVEADSDDGPFDYVDTSSSRAGIDAISDRVRGERIAIVGLGGTGSYVLDLVAKTPVSEIHPFDGDRYFTHNAFRGPGAPTLAELQAAPFKVHHFTATYSKMHRGIVPHPYPIDETNVDELSDFTFVFVCVDDGEAKELIFNALEQHDISFVDVGMGVEEVDGKLLGIVRTTASTPGRRDHLAKRVSFGAPIDDLYRSNIQIAELNALNSALAIIRWKKERGIYADLEQEHHSLYGIDGNHIVNEDQP